MKIRIFIIALLSSIMLVSCAKKNNYVGNVATTDKSSEYTKLVKINKKYNAENGKKFSIRFNFDRKFVFTTNYKFLKTDSIDFAVVSNINYPGKDTLDKEYGNIKSVLPINSRILYIAYNKEKIKPGTIEDLFEGKKVAILSNETVFIKGILNDLGVDISKVTFLMSKSNLGDDDTNKMDSKTRDSISKIEYNNSYKLDKTIPYDIEVGFSPQRFTSSGRLFKMLNARPEFELFSLDDYTLYKNGSTAEGFCLRNKYFTPYLLPKGAFGEYPKTPILTIREDFVLAARNDVDEEFIYDFVKTAIEETDLIDMVAYGSNFENISFAFPLHEGTKRYLDKNAPKFFEKYGELLGKMGAGIGGIYTAFMGFLIWRKQRRRRTIVHDLHTVLDIQARLNLSNTTEELEEMYKELQTIQANYHLKMIEREILVDETLQIFFEMCNKIEGYVLKELRKRQ